MKVKRTIFTWAMITIMFAHSFGVNMFYGLYSFDQTLFIELFCVNKDKPKMHCNGSCMLAKLDKQNSANSNKLVLPDLAQYQLTYIVQHFDLALTIPTSTENINHYTHCQNLYSSQYLKEIFHPPVVA
ncbi:MAG: hypothetical protein KF781_11540 [Chitinophagaceae bacterium]|nr:hypothetical protein [Chitinophagaceae bacterium]MCW5905824.1 hypothetical protein [Chitinophagaceae bacterium]